MRDIGQAWRSIVRDFAAIENLDGYLFVVLRNLYRAQLRRATQGPGGPASTVDYDSAEAGLKAADPRNRLQAMEELRLVCRYACARKESSKSGSALILRFFHGYYPGEIAALTLISRAAVKELLRMARAEAKLFLDDPAKLGFIAEQISINDVEIKTGATIDETIGGLRARFSHRRKGAVRSASIWVKSMTPAGRNCCPRRCSATSSVARLAWKRSIVCSICRRFPTAILTICWDPIAARGRAAAARKLLGHSVQVLKRKLDKTR